jgi:hypothetical protein
MWSDIDALFRWCPGIQTLSLMGNPLLEGKYTAVARFYSTNGERLDPHLGRFWRQFTIARVPTLLTLDSTAVNTPRAHCIMIAAHSYHR